MLNAIQVDWATWAVDEHSPGHSSPGGGARRRDKNQVKIYAVATNNYQAYRRHLIHKWTYHVGEAKAPRLPSKLGPRRSLTPTKLRQ